MPSQQTDHLFTLIKSLSKSEKRHFKLFVNRNQSSQDTKFLLLFDFLDKAESYDEALILRRIPSIKKQQLSNLKAHLYKQLLVSLRLLHNTKMVDIQIRENLDYARILYKKGLYMQSLKILTKAKAVAKANYLDVLRLEILEFEKLIESRHITRSLEGRATELEAESRKLIKNINYTSQLSSLSLRLYGIYLKRGHIRNSEDVNEVDEFLEKNLPPVRFEKMTYYEQLYWCQSFTWYHIIKQDWLNYYKYSAKWVELMESEVDILARHPVTYMKGLHNVLNALFLIGKYEKHNTTLEKLENYYQTSARIVSTNTDIRAFLYIYLARLNQIFTEGKFTEGLSIIPELEAKLEEYKLQLDVHRVLIFYYKMACLFFGAGDNANAIVYLNKIIQLKIGNLRTDIQCFARMLHLISHYELKHYDLLEHLLKSVYRFLIKHEDLSQVVTEVLRFLRKALYSDPNNLTAEFKELKTRLEDLQLDPYERRSFLYLDLISWLESKIEGVLVEQIIRKKFLASSQVVN